MKKTIAILLVLVIAMAGVWAETAVSTALSKTLKLQTNVPAVNQMIIVSPELSIADVDWDSFGNEAAFDPDYTDISSSGVYLVTNDLFNTTSTYTPIAKIVARSNDRAGVKLSVEASALIDSTTYSTATGSTVSEDSKNIDYSVKVGKANLETIITFEDGVRTLTGTNQFGTLSYTDDTGMSSDEWGVGLVITEDLDTVAAGDYTADITFTFTSNA